MTAAANTIVELIARQSHRTPAALAILAPGRAALTFEGLARQIAATILSLANSGFGRGDRVVPVEELPRTPLGKVNLGELARLVAPRLRARFVPPRDRHEELVAGFFATARPAPAAFPASRPRCSSPWPRSTSFMFLTVAPPPRCWPS